MINSIIKNTIIVTSYMLWIQLAYAEKPYVSEMPDTIGQGMHQLEYSIEYLRPRHRPAGISELSLSSHDISYTYGFNKDLDLAINIPFDNFYLKAKNNYNISLQNNTQLQDLEIATKLRYYQSNATELAAKLTISLPTGDENMVNSSRSYGKSNLSLTAAHRLKINKQLTVHNNITIASQNRRGAKNTAEIMTTLGSTYQFNPQISGVFDAGYSFDTRDLNSNSRFLTIGAQYANQSSKVGAGFKITRSGHEIEHSYNLGFQQVF